MTPELGATVLEQLRLVGGLVDVLHTDIVDIKQRVSAVEARLDGMDAPLIDLNARLNGVAQRIDRFDDRLAHVELRRDPAGSDRHVLMTDPAAKPRGTPLL